MTPNKERLRLWVAALRSGEFRQGRNWLRDGNDRYCCLGVMCEVAGRNGLPVVATQRSDEDDRKWDYEVAGSTDKFGAADRSAGYPPNKIVAWYGLLSEAPIVGGKNAGHWVGAVQANDDLRRTFEQIADAIEEYYQLKEDDGDGSDGK